jgi:hypothetical protein
MEASGQFRSSVASFLGKEPPVRNGQDAGRAPEPLWTLQRKVFYSCQKSELQFLGRPARSFLVLVSWGGVRLSPLGTSATNWPTVPAPDDRWWMWCSRWNENWQGGPKYSEKTGPSATLSITNPTWSDLGSNPGRRRGKPATNRLSYDTASP